MVVVSHLFPFYGNILPNYSYFNLRLREGGDCYPGRPGQGCNHFNPRLQKGGDALLLSAFRLKNNFNPRLQEGGDGINPDTLYTWKFQSTPPRRRRLQHIVMPQLSYTYLVLTAFLSSIFSFISQYVVLFFLF